MNSSQSILLVLAFLLANIPFFSSRFLGKKIAHKRFFHYLIEWLCALVLAIVLFRVLENRATTTIHPQGWIFYSVVVCLFAVVSFPGFVYRYFWRSRKLHS